MPNRPPTFTTRKPGAITPRAFRKPDRRGSRHERGYTNAWVKLRLRHLARQPLCVHCEAQGRTTPAKDVDHIIPISEGADPLDMDNLQSLCRACHNRKTHGQSKTKETET